MDKSNNSLPEDLELYQLYQSGGNLPLEQSHPDLQKPPTNIRI